MAFEYKPTARDNSLEYGPRETTGDTAIPTTNFEGLAVRVNPDNPAAPATGVTDKVPFSLSSGSTLNEIVGVAVRLSDDQSEVGVRMTGWVWMRTVTTTNLNQSIGLRVTASATHGSCQATANTGAAGKGRIGGWRSRTLADGTTTVYEYWVNLDA